MSKKGKNTLPEPLHDAVQTDEATPPVETPAADGDKKRVRADRWRPGNFLLQVAVVLIGVIITFQGNTLIENSKLDKQGREILSMIEDELTRNLGELQSSQRIIEGELAGADFFIRYMDDIRSAPTDSLRDFFWVLGTGHTFNYRSNALQVLNSSVQASGRIDKKLMSMIFLCYDDLRSTITSLNYYSESKLDVIGDYYYSADRDAVQAMDMGDPYSYVEGYLKHRSTGNLILNTAGVLAGKKEDVERLTEQIVLTLEMIAKEIK